MILAFYFIFNCSFISCFFLTFRFSFLSYYLYPFLIFLSSFITTKLLYLFLLMLL
jgi:hypothetical protein